MEVRDISELDRVPSADCQQQAQSFFKVLVKKGYSVEEMADILSHMGKMFVGYCEQCGKL